MGEIISTQISDFNKEIYAKAAYSTRTATNISDGKEMISIIIPVYNQAEYLAEAIESALNQTVNCEVIVVNDGSTDNSLEIAKKYPVKIIDQVNKGLASARNTGIMNAKGDWILPLDADDVLHEKAIETIEFTIGFIITPEIDIIGPSFRCFGKYTDQVILMPNPTLEDFKTGNRIGYCSAIKKSVLLEIGGYNSKMIWGWEDYDLWFDLLKRGKKIITIPDVLWFYRTKKVSMITEANKHSKELWEQIYKNHSEIWKN